MERAMEIEGGEGYAINVRYERDFRDNVDELRRVLIGTPSGAQIPLDQVATISFSHGPAMIRDEDGQLTGYVYIDLNTKDYGGRVSPGPHRPGPYDTPPRAATSPRAAGHGCSCLARRGLQTLLHPVVILVFVV